MAIDTTRFKLDENPLTDPRSLGVSVVLHLVFVGVASLTILQASVPKAIDAGIKVMRGELGPVDNRAEERDPTSGAGGGAPGEIGGVGGMEFVSSSEVNDAGGASRDPADALISEILPSGQPQPNVQQPGAGGAGTGQGAIPGSGTGGGGGSGGGSGGGIGRSIGPGTQFFGTRDHANSFAYVIDCSGSMGPPRNPLDVAKRELLASLNQLPPDVEFCVVFYNSLPHVLSDPRGRKGLMTATTANKVRVQNQLQNVLADGGSDHMGALRSALSLKPEVLFFLTDADLMKDREVNEILREVGPTRIQAIELGHGTDLGQVTPLRRLANTTGGTYRYIDVRQLPRTGDS